VPPLNELRNSRTSYGARSVPPTMDSKLYDELWRVEQEHWWFRARRDIVWSLVQRYLGARGWGLVTRDAKESYSPQPPASSPRLHICELGCGTGGNLVSVADQHDVVGVECSPWALAYARQRLGERIIRGRLPDEVDLPSNSFDVVLLTDVLEHVEDDARSAATAMRLLRPGGIVVATVPAYQWLYTARDAQHHHFRRYSKQRFESLWSSNDCQTLLLSYYNSILFPIAVAARVTSKLRQSDGSGDLSVPHWAINSALTGVMRCERNVLGRAPLPFGLSLITVIRKRQFAVSKKHRPAA
jgi:2-polyprenyl-3-methyl-5-hydroxy-6-metoxy-1,4-benzoquinol methylase